MLDFYVKLLHLTYAHAGLHWFVSLESLHRNSLRYYCSATLSVFSCSSLAKILAKIQF